MKVLLLTPLFPPDIADPAPYLKELVTHLSDKHTVHVICYGNLPEKVAGVQFTVIKKHYPTILRLFLCTIHLFKEALKHDSIVVENGPSTELPAFFVSIFFKNKMLLHQSDTKNDYAGFSKTIHSILSTRVNEILVCTDNETGTYLPPTLPRPEILPFSEISEKEMREYKDSWNTHLEKFNAVLKYYE